MSDPCVIARLAGGLGNQLFMYAFNLALAERNQSPAKLNMVVGFGSDLTSLLRHLLNCINDMEEHTMTNRQLAPEEIVIWSC